MSLSRRGFLLGSLAWGAGLSTVGLTTTSCGRLGLPGASTGGGLPSVEDVRGALRDLVKQAGRETFQWVEVSSADYGGGLRAKLLMPDGGVRTFEHDDGWQKDDYDEKSILTSPASVRLAELPLDRLPAYVGAAKAKIDSLTFDADYVGKIQVWVTRQGSADDLGIKLDGSGPVPHFDPDEVDGVRSAIAEIVAVYGRQAERIGSFNGFVHMDGNVAGCHAGQRIVRRPWLAATANIVQETPFHRSRLFDPTRFDPTMVLARKATIAKEARVKGKVWDWEYRRPPKGGAPLVSYGIGPHGPSTRVWLNEHGKIAAVDGGHCKKTPGWCPS
jgi:hypothetical protein